MRAHIEPRAWKNTRVVPLWHPSVERIADPAPDPEAALIAKQEPIQLPRRRRELDLSRLEPGDALAIDWWLLGLTQAEVGVWLGVGQVRVHQRIRRGIARLKGAGDAQRR